MKKYLLIGIIILLVIGTITGLIARINYLSKERTIYRNNTHSLLDSVQRYKVMDSLNVVSLHQINLTLAEYKRYRVTDYESIKKLKVDNKRLEQITKTKTATIYELKGKVKDSLIYIDRHIIDTVKCFNYSDMWLQFAGCFDAKDVFTGRIESRDSLLYVEHIVPKRFLGFLWKYGIKERKQDIVSFNPHTIIVNAEFVTIRE